MTMQPYDPPANPAMLDRTTDSWTAVLTDVVSLAENISNTEFVPQGLRGSTTKVVAAILHGRELGLAPMTALAHTQVINGRPGTSAEVMRALILQAGHDLHIESSTAEKCTIRGRRHGWAEDRWTTVTFTIQDAAKAGLLEDKRSKDGKVTPSMYKRWPQAMLLARASTILARMIFADVIHGMRSIEELQDMGDDSLESSGYTPAAPPQTTTVSRQPSIGQPAAVEAEAPSQGGTAGASGKGVGASTSEQQPSDAPAPGRRRAPLKRHLAAAPDPAPATEPEEAPVAEALPDADGVVEAEVLPDEPQGKSWREKTMAQVQMQWVRILGMPVARDERLWWTGVIIGRPVDSTRDVTDEELATLLNKLGRMRDRESLEQFNRGGDDE